MAKGSPPVGRAAGRLSTGPRLVVVVLVVVLVLAAAGAAWWRHQRQRAEAGPGEPMCLVFTRQDVQPVLDKPVRTFGTGYSSSGLMWTCGLNGSNQQTLYFQVTPQVDNTLVNYKDIGVPVVETLVSRRGGVSTPVPGTSATVISWIQGGEAHAGWFDGQSAAVVSTWNTHDAQAAAGYIDALTDLITLRGPDLLNATGYTPEPTPTP